MDRARLPTPAERRQHRRRFAETAYLRRPNTHEAPTPPVTCDLCSAELKSFAELIQHQGITVERGQIRRAQCQPEPQAECRRCGEEMPLAALRDHWRYDTECIRLAMLAADTDRGLWVGRLRPPPAAAAEFVPGMAYCLSCGWAPEGAHPHPDRLADRHSTRTGHITVARGWPA
jgi:hypothetical protein